MRHHRLFLSSSTDVASLLLSSSSILRTILSWWSFPQCLNFVSLDALRSGFFEGAPTITQESVKAIKDAVRLLMSYVFASNPGTRNVKAKVSRHICWFAIPTFYRLPTISIRLLLRQIYYRLLKFSILKGPLVSKSRFSCPPVWLLPSKRVAACPPILIRSSRIWSLLWSIEFEWKFMHHCNDLIGGAHRQVLSLYYT